MLHAVNPMGSPVKQGRITIGVTSKRTEPGKVRFVFYIHVGLGLLCCSFEKELSSYLSPFSAFHCFFWRRFTDRMDLVTRYAIMHSFIFYLLRYLHIRRFSSMVWHHFFLGISSIVWHHFLLSYLSRTLWPFWFLKIETCLGQYCPFCTSSHFLL